MIKTSNSIDNRTTKSLKKQLKKILQTQNTGCRFFKSRYNKEPFYDLMKRSTGFVIDKMKKTILPLILFSACTSLKQKPEEVNDRGFLSFKGDLKIICPASYRDILELRGLLKEFNNEILVCDGKVPFHAKDDSERFFDLKTALYGKEKILWAYQGGYGTSRLLRYLEQIPMNRLPPEKMIVGYSDITALHLFVSKKWGWKTLHAPIFLDLISTTKDSSNLDILFQILTKKALKWSLPNLTALNEKAKTTHEVKGVVTGGNLTMIIRSLKTSWEMEGENKIVFIEDVGEKGYRIDRNLDHLKESGVLEGAKAIVFGDMQTQAQDEHIDFALKRFAEKIQTPVFKTDQFGHGEHNIPVLYNAESVIEDGQMTFYFTKALS
jgi:muramoyltetrapeptide carboxypeptidase